MSNGVSASSKRDMSAPTHRRDERDLAAITRHIVPAREGTVYRNPQAVDGQFEPITCPQFQVQHAQVRRGGLERLRSDFGGIAQAGEIQHGDVGGHPAAPRSWAPKSCFPPRLPSSFAGPITILCDRALHMS